MTQNSINFLSKILSTFVPRRVFVEHSKHIVIATALFVLVAIAVPGQTNAQDLSAAIKRMDEIIAEMQALRAEFLALSSQTTTVSTPSPSVLGASYDKTLTQDLSYGVTNSDIERIQRLLATDSEIYPYGVASGFFGPKTQEAIRNFQTRFGLSPVGVIGPATTAILEVFFNAYPDEQYPAGVLTKKPTTQVLGARTSVTTPTTHVVDSSNPASSITADYDRGESKVKIVYKNGNKNNIIVTGDTESEIIKAIAGRTPLSEAQVRAVIEFDGLNGDSSGDADEGDAEDAIDDADNKIDDVDDNIKEAEDDGDDVDWADDTLDEAIDLLGEAEDAFDDEDWDKAVELAEDAEAMAKKAKDRIDEKKGSTQGNSDDIKSIRVDVDVDDSNVRVRYHDYDDYKFTLEEDKEDELIEDIADELDMDENDVEDLIEFNYGDIDQIDALVDEEEDETKVTIKFETGVKLRLTIDSADEDDVIGEIADRLDEDERDIEDLTKFDY